MVEALTRSNLGTALAVADLATDTGLSSLLIAGDQRVYRKTKEREGVQVVCIDGLAARLPISPALKRPCVPAGPHGLRCETAPSNLPGLYKSS